MPYNVFVEAISEFGGDKYWNWLTIFSLKQWGNSAQTSFEIFWQFFRWNDEEIQLRRVFRLPYNVFVEAMRGFGWHKFLDCLRIFSLKWWRILAQASFEIVWQCFLGSDEEIRLRRVLKLSYNVFVEAMREVGWDKYWNCLRIFLLRRWANSSETSFEIVTIFSLKWWRNPVKTCFEIALQCFRWSDEGSRLRQVLRLS